MTIVDIAEIEVRQKSQLRDESGRFLEEVREGARESVEELADFIAGQAITNVATKLRTRTGALLSAIKSRAKGYVGEAYVDFAIAPHGAPQEKGARSHDIPNSFGWGHEYGFGKDRNPPALHFHPGNPAVRYMAEAGQGAALVGLMILRKNMPG